MQQQQEQTTNTQETREAETPAASGFEPITSQEQLDKLITARLAREKAKYADYEDLKAKAAQFDQIEEANKTELQKAQERLADVEKARTEAELKLLRHEVAASKGLDGRAASFLHGSSREELEQSADELAGLLEGAKPVRLRPDPTQGREEKASTESTDWLRDAMNKR